MFLDKLFSAVSFSKSDFFVNSFVSFRLYTLDVIPEEINIWTKTMEDLSGFLSGLKP